MTEYESHQEKKWAPFCSTQKKTCGTSFKKKREKPFLKTQSRVLSLLTHSAKSAEAFPSPSRCFFSLSPPPLKLQPLLPFNFIRTQPYVPTHSFWRLNNTSLFSLQHKPSDPKLSAAFPANSWHASGASGQPHRPTLWNFGTPFCGLYSVHIKERSMFCFIFLLPWSCPDRQPYFSLSCCTLFFSFILLLDSCY